jgi:membrane protein required for colicin V production
MGDIIMNWPHNIIDLIIIIVGVIVIYKGYKKGLVRQIIWLGSIVIGFLVGSYFSYGLANLLGFRMLNERLTIAVSFVILIVGTIFVMHFVAKWITKILNWSPVGVINAILGAILNGVIYLAIIAVVTTVGIQLIPKFDTYLEKTTVLKHIISLDKVIMDKRIIDRLEKTIEKID